jgi:outer membrane protein assembly factor BamB
MTSLSETKSMSAANSSNDNNNPSKIKSSNSSNVTPTTITAAKLIMGQKKRGDLFALDVRNGHLVRRDKVGIQYHTDAIPRPQGSGTLWPGTQYGVETCRTNNNDTVYAAVSNMAFNFFVKGTSGHAVSVFDAIANGVSNGTITAVDMKTGKVKWVHPTQGLFLTWVSPLVTNGVVFSGHITAIGEPYKYNDFGAPTDTQLVSSGIIIAIDKDTCKSLWEFNVGAPIGIDGPSIGHGMLFVTTGSHA